MKTLTVWSNGGARLALADSIVVKDDGHLRLYLDGKMVGFFRFGNWSCVYIGAPASK